MQNYVNAMMQGCLAAAWSVGDGMEGLGRREVAMATAAKVQAALKGVIDAGMGYLGVDTSRMGTDDAIAAAEAFYEASGNMFPLPVVARAIEATQDISAHAELLKGGAWVDFGRVIAEGGSALKRDAHAALDMVGERASPPVRFVAEGHTLKPVRLSVN